MTLTRLIEDLQEIARRAPAHTDVVIDDRRLEIVDATYHGGSLVVISSVADGEDYDDAD